MMITPLDISWTNEELYGVLALLGIILLVVLIIAFLTGRWRP